MHSAHQREEIVTFSSVFALGTLVLKMRWDSSSDVRREGNARLGHSQSQSHLLDSGPQNQKQG